MVDQITDADTLNDLHEQVEAAQRWNDSEEAQYASCADLLNRADTLGKKYIPILVSKMGSDGSTLDDFGKPFD